MSIFSCERKVMVVTMKATNKPVLAAAGLVFAAFLSGCNFLFINEINDNFPYMMFLCLSNLAALIPLGIFGFRRIRKIQIQTLKTGFLCGALVTGFAFFQMIGAQEVSLINLTALHSISFIYVLLYLILLKRRVNFLSGISTLIAVISMAMIIDLEPTEITLTKNGIWLTLANMLYAGYLVAVEVRGQDTDPVQLVFSQILFSAVIAFAGWMITAGMEGSGLSLPKDKTFWEVVVLSGLLNQLTVRLLQISAQKYFSSLQTALILSLRLIFLVSAGLIFIKVIVGGGSPFEDYQYISIIFLLIAIFLSTETVQRRLGYHGVNFRSFVRKDDAVIKGQTVAGKMILSILSLSMISMLLASVIAMVSLRSISQTILTDSENMGRETTDISMDALNSELEEDLSSRVVFKAAMMEERLSQYGNDVYYAASYAHTLLVNSAAYPSREVDPLRAGGDETQTMWRTLATEEIDYEDIRNECRLLGNMEDIFSPITEGDDGIATIFIAMDNGLMISYDPGIGEDDRETGAAEENYYEYRDADWYERTRSAEDYVITEPHPNAYGRGQVITFLAPVKNAESRFAGCIGIDIRLEDLNESIVKYWIPPHISVLLTDLEGNVLSGSGVDYDQWPFGTIYDSERYGSLSEAAEDILTDGGGVFQVGKDDNAACIASAPVDSAGWKLCLEMPVSAINETTDAIRENIDKDLEMTSYSIRLGLVKILRNILMLTELILLAIIFMSENLSRRITSPLIQLERDVTEISAGNFQQRSGVTSNDEIGSLAASFNNMADSLEHYIADIREMTAKEERIAAELTLAAQIQDGMLPKDTGRFSAGRGFELGAFMKPAKEVAGDFYDYFMIDDEHLALVIADVSGKGVPAALIMARAMTSIRMRASAGGTPARILKDVNLQMCERNDEQLFVTVWFSIIDLKTGRGLAANAGHEHPVLRKGGGSYEYVIYKHSPMIGAFKERDLKSTPLNLNPVTVSWSIRTASLRRTVVMPKTSSGRTACSRP